MQIDVVVPAYNAGLYIDRCIGGLIHAGFERGEITIVDDGSTDDTALRSRSYGVRVLELGQNTSAASARNAGAREGHAGAICFVDADVLVSRSFRSVLEDFFCHHPDYAAVFGAYDSRPSAPGRVSRIRNLLHRHVHVENAGPAVTFWSGCGAVRRSAFEAIGGFDARIEMMEDVYLGLRLTLRGERILLLPELEGKHLKEWSLTSMVRTDLLNRAIPWARLLARPETRAVPRTLNIGLTGRLSVLAVAFSIASAIALPLAPTGALMGMVASIGLLVAINRKFIRGLSRDHGVIDAAAAVPVLWLHYLCGGVGFAWVWLTHSMRAS